MVLVEVANRYRRLVLNSLKNTMAEHRPIVAFFLAFLAVGGSCVRFSIDAQVDQIFRIIEETHEDVETSDMKLTMTPADFNFIVPFTVRMTCSDGLMVAKDIRRVHQEDIYMDAINDNETFISVRFTIAELDFRYELCWLSLIIPVPLWLRGKILQSTYYVTSKISYKPTCEFAIVKASLESYEKISLNVFNWLPGGLGDAMSEMLARNTQDRIYDTVSKSIEKTLIKLATVYDACVAFPALGRLIEVPPKDDLEEELDESEDPLLAVAKQDELESRNKLDAVEAGETVENDAAKSTEVKEDGAEKRGKAVEIKADEQEKAINEEPFHQVPTKLATAASHDVNNEKDTGTCTAQPSHEDTVSDSNMNSQSCCNPKSTKAQSTNGMYEIIRDKVLGQLAQDLGDE